MQFIAVKWNNSELFKNIIATSVVRVAKCSFTVSLGAKTAVLDSVFSARCIYYISRLCYDVSVGLSVRLSVTEVHWHIIANLGFKFRSQFTAHRGRGACGREGRDHRR